jgi:hypothetical protein
MIRLRAEAPSAKRRPGRTYQGETAINKAMQVGCAMTIKQASDGEVPPGLVV